MRETRRQVRAPVEPLPAGRGALLLGASAGLVGGVAMAGCMVLCATLEGYGALAQLEPLGAMFKGPGAVAGGGADLVYGLAVQLAYAAVAGVVFAVVFPRDLAPGAAAVVGVAYAMVLMSFSTALFLPAVNPGMREAMRDLGGSWVLAYALFGASLALLPWRLRARAARRAAHA